MQTVATKQGLPEWAKLFLIVGIIVITIIVFIKVSISEKFCQIVQSILT